MEIYFLWNNLISFDDKNGKTFDFSTLSNMDILDNDIKINSIWNDNFEISYKDKNILFVKNLSQLIFENKKSYDLLFLDIFSQDIFLDKLFNINATFKVIVPTWYDNRFHKIDILNDFARDIMINNIATPKVIKPWQYIYL